MVPNPDVYFRGRFSDGPIWVDHLAAILSGGGNNGTSNSSGSSRGSSSTVTGRREVVVRVFAYGGATACAGQGLSRQVPDLDTQVRSFLEGRPGADARPTTTTTTSTPATSQPSTAAAATATNTTTAAAAGQPAAGAGVGAGDRVFVVFTGGRRHAHDVCACL